MNILFTGASSFTGFWLVKALAAAGHEIVCPTRQGPLAYTATRQARVERLRPLCRLVPETPFGSENFLNLVRENHFDLLCHHAAEMADYRSASFNALHALQNNTLNLRAVLAALRSRGLKACLLTGSVFEPDEGTSGPGPGETAPADSPRRAFSPYGLSKGLTFQVFRHYCHEAGLPLGKFVIPNPFGPFEEPRFTAFLMKSWKDGKPAEVKTPDYVRDNIHVDLLAAVYARFAAQTAAATVPLLKTNPSGYAEKQGEFAQRVAREMKARLGWACELKLAQQEDFSEPRHRTNTEPAALAVPEWDESKAWDAFADYYSK